MVNVPDVRPAAGAGANRARSAVQDTTVRQQSSIGEGFGQVAKSLEGFAKQVQETNIRRDRLELSEREAKFQTQVQEEISDLDPSAPDYVEQVEERVNNIKQQQVEDAEFNTDEIRQQANSRFEVIGQAQVRTAFSAREEALEKRAVNRYEEIAQEGLAQLRQNPQDEDVILGETAAKLEDLNGSIPTARQEELNGELAKQFAVNKAIGLAGQGDVQGAREVIDDNQSELSTDEFRSIKRTIRQIESQNEQERNAAVAREVADTRININSARTEQDLSDAQNTIDRLDKQGFFKGRQGLRANLQIQLNSRRQNIQERDRERSAISKNLANGFGLDSQEQANEAFEMLFRDQGFNPDDEQDLENFGDTVSRFGFMPDQMSLMVENGETVEDPQTLARAARIHDEVKSEAPQLSTGARDAGSRVRLTREFKRSFGVGFQEAAQQVLDKSPADQNTRRNRQEEFESNNFSSGESFDMNEFLQDTGIISGGFLGIGGENFKNVVTPRAQRQIRDIAKLSYMESGDISLAKGVTAEKAKEFFGRTQITGEEMVMRRPPEPQVLKGSPRLREGLKFGSVTQKDVADIVASDLKNELDQRGIKPDNVIGATETETRQEIEAVDGDVQGGAPAAGRRAAERLEEGERTLTEEQVDLSSIPGVMLQADSRTEKEIENGRPPSYKVLVRGRFGEMQTVPVEGGDVFRYRVPTDNELDNIEAFQKLQSRISGEARGKQSRRIIEDQDPDQGPSRLFQQ